MECGFSETQFAFGWSFEIVQILTSQKGWSPVFPTQVKEGNCGYDLELQGPVNTLFVQFKVPEYKSKSYSKYWNIHNGPYYEFKIWSDNTSHQHNILVKKANEKPLVNRVFYVSPGFNEVDEWRSNYSNRTIVSNSIYVNCKNMIKIQEKDRHSVSYTISPKEYYFHSEPKLIQSYVGEEFISEIKRLEPFPSLDECLNQFSEAFSINNNKQYESKGEKLHDIAVNALEKYNLQMLVF